MSLVLRRPRPWPWLLLLSALLAPFSLASAQPAPPATVTRATLGNGLRVVIVPNPLAGAVTTEVNYLVGSKETPTGFPGMAHAQEHMMFRGGPGLSAAQLADITAAMGGMFNAETQQTVTQYYFTVPSEDLDVALHIEATRMRAISDDAPAWRQERKALDQEVAQDESNPEYKFYTQLLRALFAGTPYAEDALGSEASFEKTTATMLQHFHEQWYAPNNAILVIVGNVEPQATLAQVRKLFGDIPARKLPERPAVNLQPVQATTLNQTTDTPYGLAIVAFRLPGSDSPDYAASQVLADVLNSQRGTLYGLVPAGKALYAGFDNDAWPQTGLGYAAAAFADGSDGAALARDVMAVLRHARDRGFSPELIEAAKRREITQAEFQKNSVSGLASTWSQALAVEHRQSPDDDVRAIQRVTAADVDRVARRYLDLDHAVTALLTPQRSGSAIAAAPVAHVESFTPKQVARVPLPTWAGDILTRLSPPTSALHPSVSTLSNGLTLIVQPESVSDTVSVYGHVRITPPLETPPGHEGVDEVLDQLFAYGTTSLDRAAYQKALDDIGAETKTGENFRLRVLADDFERGVHLLADNELHPALPPNAFAIVRRQVAQTVAGRLHSPDYLMQRAVDTALFPPHDPSLRRSTPASVTGLSLAEVKDYYRNAFRPDLTTIVVIGNITPAQARATIERYFGPWQAQGPRPRTTLSPVPLNAVATTFVPDRSRTQDKILLAETLGLNRHNPDYYALELGNHVLGGAFYATRLYRDLREDAGLVYFVDSAFDLDRTRGTYNVSYACDPANVNRARAIVEHDVQDLRIHDVSADELTQAKALLLREIPLAQASEDGIAQGYLARKDLDLPLDEPEQAARRYVALTAKDVRQAFAKWVDPKRLVQVSEGPSPK